MKQKNTFDPGDAKSFSRKYQIVIFFITHCKYSKRKVADYFWHQIFLSGYEQLNVLREIDLRKVKAPKPKLMPEPASDVFNIVFYCASLS